MQTTPRAVTIEEELFVDDGSVPNNPWLPLIVLPRRTPDRSRGR